MVGEHGESCGGDGSEHGFGEAGFGVEEGGLDVFDVDEEVLAGGHGLIAEIFLFEIVHVIGGCGTTATIAVVVVAVVVNVALVGNVGGAFEDGSVDVDVSFADFVSEGGDVFGGGASWLLDEDLIVFVIVVIVVVIGIVDNLDISIGGNLSHDDILLGLFRGNAATSAGWEHGVRTPNKRRCIHTQLTRRRCNRHINHTARLHLLQIIHLRHTRRHQWHDTQQVQHGRDQCRIGWTDHDTGRKGDGHGGGDDGEEDADIDGVASGGGVDGGGGWGGPLVVGGGTVAHGRVDDFYFIIILCLFSTILIFYC